MTKPHLSLEHLQLCLLEEACELAKEMSKASRFGLENFEPGKKIPLTNRKKMLQETGDLLGVIGLIIYTYIQDIPDYEELIEALAMSKEQKLKDNYGIGSA